MSDSVLPPLVIHSCSPEDSGRLAARVAERTPLGLVIALDGELGAGKTRFVRDFCSQRGVDPERVNSPTFVLLQYYAGDDGMIAHMDAYRLEGTEEFEAIGGVEVLDDPQSVCLIEWADRIRELLPADHLSIRIIPTGEQSRRFELQAVSGAGADLLQALRDA